MLKYGTAQKKEKEKKWNGSEFRQENQISIAVTDLLRNLNKTTKFDPHFGLDTFH